MFLCIETFNLKRCLLVLSLFIHKTEIEFGDKQRKNIHIFFFFFTKLQKSHNCRSRTKMQKSHKIAEVAQNCTNCTKS